MSTYTPTWSGPQDIGILQSTRSGGCSSGVYHSFNLGMHVQDKAQSVAKNRALLNQALPNNGHFIEQVHGHHVHVLEHPNKDTQQIQADGLFTRLAQQPLVIMTADCLAVLLASSDGREIAALHCGWRSLAGGIISHALALFNSSNSSIHAWLGPCIGPHAFEVGDDVKRAFCQQHHYHQSAFKPKGDKYLANLPLLAEQTLTHHGVEQITHSGECTFNNQTDYFSYRRDGQTGRMASVIWRK